LRRLVVLFALGLIAAAISAMPVRAASGPPQPRGQPNWQQRDTAVYVVSTLNLLRTPSGQLVVDRLDVSRFDVYADVVKDGLYFIQLHAKSGALVGAVAYQLGWTKPQALSRSVGRLGVDRASRIIFRAYRADHKQLIGSFTSTVPQ
jgi:hypothetical protein